jgi:hypothetical protein
MNGETLITDPCKAVTVSYVERPPLPELAGTERTVRI